MSLSLRFFARDILFSLIPNIFNVKMRLKRCDFFVKNRAFFLMGKTPIMNLQKINCKGERKMKKRRFAATMLAVVMAGSLAAGCSSSSPNTAASGEESPAADTGTPASGAVSLSLADAQPDGCAANLAMKAMVEEINEKSGGSMNVTYYPNSQLGNERDLAEGVIAGTVDMAWISCAVMQNFTEDFAIFSLPYIFKDYDHVHAYADSELSDQIFKKLEDAQKVKVLGLFDQGFRWIWTSNKEVTTLEDLKGLKLRTPESDVYTKTFTLLGTNPTPMAFGDLFTALQTGVVEGYEVNPESTWANGTYEAIKYGVKSNHIFAGSILFISQSAYDRLNDEQKQILMDAADQAVIYNNEIALEAEAEYEKNLVDAGLVINPLADGEQEKFAEAVLPLYEEYYDMVGGKDYVDQVRGMEY